MKIVLSLILVCCLLKSYSQEQNAFVEVMVQDSMEVEPEEIFYIVALTHPQFSMDSSLEMPKTVSKNKSAKTESPSDKLTKLISASGIDTIPVSEFNIQMREYIRFDKTVLLHFTSKDKLISFVKAAQGIDGLLGSILSLKNSKLELFNQQLTGKLLNKAKADAAYIAGQSGKKLGNLLQIREDKIDEPIGGWTMYPPLSALYDSNLGLATDKIILKQKLYVRYAW